jgi:hypothetical protein
MRKSQLPEETSGLFPGKPHNITENAGLELLPTDFWLNHSSKKAVQRWVLVPTHGGVKGLLANKAIGRQEYGAVESPMRSRSAIDMKMRPSVEGCAPGEQGAKVVCTLAR